MMSLHDYEAELKRIRSVSDTLCTGHANLRDKFSRLALGLDLTVLAISAWLIALVWAEPRLNIQLTPFGISPAIWTGLLTIFVFLLTIVQLKVDWKGRADAHRRSLDVYSEVKRESGYLLASRDFSESACRKVFERYDLASAVGIEIPEVDFLRLKQKHKIKILVSKRLDDHPSTSIFLFLLKSWIKENFGSDRSDIERH